MLFRWLWHYFYDIIKSRWSFRKWLLVLFKLEYLNRAEDCSSAIRSYSLCYGWLVIWRLVNHIQPISLSRSVSLHFLLSLSSSLLQSNHFTFSEFLSWNRRTKYQANRSFWQFNFNARLSVNLIIILSNHPINVFYIYNDHLVSSPFWHHLSGVKD